MKSFAFPLGFFSVVGLVSKSAALHLVIVLTALSLMMSAFFLIRSLSASA